MTFVSKTPFVLALALMASPVLADQVPGAAAAPAIPISGQDRFYSADQFSNTVSVVDPSTNGLLGVISLGEPTPANLSPLYKGQLLVHGIGAAPDGKTIASVAPDYRIQRWARDGTPIGVTDPPPGILVAPISAL